VKVVGGADTGDEEFHAALWIKGRITDLNPDGDCFSFAAAINSQHQIIGKHSIVTPTPFGLSSGTNGPSST
jgi:uncharacterized membrane protein